MWTAPSFPSFPHLLPLPTWDGPGPWAVHLSTTLSATCWLTIYTLCWALLSSSSSAVSEQRGCSPQAQVPVNKCPVSGVLSSLSRIKASHKGKISIFAFSPSVELILCVCVCVVSDRMKHHSRVGKALWVRSKSSTERGHRILLEFLGDRWANPNGSHGAVLLRPYWVLYPSQPHLVFQIHLHAPSTHRWETDNSGLHPSAQEAELGSHLKRQPCCYYKNRGGKKMNPYQQILYKNHSMKRSSIQTLYTLCTL